MKTIDFSYFIERYIAGEMNQNELAWFTKEMEGNLSLQKEVLLRKKTDLILERQDILSLRNKLASIEKSRKAEKIAKGKINSWRIRYAAIFTGLIVIGSLLFFSFRTENPARLFTKYYETYEYPGVSRSADASVYSQAIKYFNNKEFAKAGEGFEAYLRTNPSTPHIMFLNGISNMEIKRFYKAEIAFDKVLNQKVNPYTYDANWYLAMCYLATSDKLKAKEQLQNIIKSESLYKNRAKQILRHL
jgi:hypothetical protein